MKLPIVLTCSLSNSMSNKASLRLIASNSNSNSPVPPLPSVNSCTREATENLQLCQTATSL